MLIRSHRFNSLIITLLGTVLCSARADAAGLVPPLSIDPIVSLQSNRSILLQFGFTQHLFISRTHQRSLEPPDHPLNLAHGKLDHPSANNRQQVDLAYGKLAAMTEQSQPANQPSLHNLNNPPTIVPVRFSLDRRSDFGGVQWSDCKAAPGGGTAWCDRAEGSQF